MEVLTAVLCDSAANYNGKLCILGAFDTIGAHRFPTIHPHCAVAIRLLFRDADAGKHRLKVNPIDPDGRSIWKGPPLQWEFEMKSVPEESFFFSQNFVANLQGLALEKPAQYSFDISLNDAIIARIPLQVVLLKKEG